MIRRRIKFILATIVLLSFFCISCKHTDNPTTNNKNSKNLDSLQIENSASTLVKFKDKVFSVPSPILISKQIRDLDLSYNNSLVIPTENYTRYHTSFEQAAALGIYSADLAYLLTYDQLSNISVYFKIIRSLSEELSLLNSITEGTLDRIENNSNNKDSLLNITSTLFRDIDSYLNENEQQELGIIILAGGWVESLYMLTKLAEDTQKEELINKIGEQQAPLNNLIQLLVPYTHKGNAQIDRLYEKLNSLYKLFESIEQEYQYEMPEIYPQKHYIVIHSTTVTKLNNTDLGQISQQISQLRNWLIK